MAIDHVIDYDCEPKRALTTEGILERLKGEERAQAIIQMYRQSGDDRAPSEMGFEFTRSTANGENETRVVIVQDLLDAANELKPLERHCAGCPANRAGKPFGCTGFIQYPISAKAEAWLLNRLPVPDDALVWLLLKQGVEEFQYDGSSLGSMRANGGIYFEFASEMTRKLGEFKITNDQVFEMLFLLGHLNPKHAAVLLMFFNAIDRDLEANEIMAISEGRQHTPFLLTPQPDDDTTIGELKEFFHALYLAWKLSVRLLLDV